MNPWDVPHQEAGSTEPVVDDDKVTIYNMRFCPYAQRTVLTLLAKGIPFDVVNINLKNKPEWFKKNTWGTVSVIRYKGQHIMESLVNSDFLDEEFPGRRLHPTDPLEKALGRLRVEKFSKISGNFYKILLSTTQEERQTAWKSLHGILEELDKELGIVGSTFFGGGTPNMTDFMIWPWNERLPILDQIRPGEGFEVPKSLKNYNKWLNGMLEDPAVKEYALSIENHVEFMKQMRSASTNYDFLLQ